MLINSNYANRFNEQSPFTVSHMYKKLFNEKSRCFIGGFTMERRISLLFGILGAVLLILLGLPEINHSYLGFSYFIPMFITSIISLVGFIFCVYFCVLLIIDTLKTIKK